MRPDWQETGVPMKTMRVCSAGLVLLACLTGVAVGAPEDPQEADHEALRQLKAVFEQAVNQNQLDLLKPYMDQGFSVVTYTDKEFTDFEQFKQQWQKTRDRLLGGGTYSIRLLPERSQILGDIAITRGDSENVMVTGRGKTFKFTAHWTAICRKSDGQWKILRGHNSLNPFSNQMLTDGVRKACITASSAALVLGLVLGWLLKTLTARPGTRP